MGLLAVLMASSCGSSPAPSGSNGDAYPLETSASPAACAGVAIAEMVIGADTGTRGPVWGDVVGGPAGRRFFLVVSLWVLAPVADGVLEIREPTGDVVATNERPLRDAQVCGLGGDRLYISAFEGYQLPSPPP